MENQDEPIVDINPKAMMYIAQKGIAPTTHGGHEEPSNHSMKLPTR